MLVILEERKIFGLLAFDVLTFWYEMLLMIKEGEKGLES